MTDDINTSVINESSSDEEPIETFDKEFLKTLSYLKNNDPIIYDKDAKFFKEQVEPVTKKVKREKRKKATIDYDKLARELEENAEENCRFGVYDWKIDKDKEGQFDNDIELKKKIKKHKINKESEDEEVIDEDQLDNDIKEGEEIKKRAEEVSDSENQEDEKETFVKAQERLKKTFQTFWEQNDGEHELFSVKEKTEEEKKKEREDYIEWAKCHKHEKNKISNLNYLSAKSIGEDVDPEDYIKLLKDQTNEIDEVALKKLRDYWNNPKLEKVDGFLKDYILNSRWKANETDFGEETDLSEDELLLDAQNEFELQYNTTTSFEADVQPQRYPRKIEGAYRKKNEKRKQKRKITAERKLKTKNLKIQEMKKVQKEKLIEIKQRVTKLKEAIGNDSLGLDDKELFGTDFEPEKDDGMMENGNDFYEGNMDENEVKTKKSRTQMKKERKKKKSKKLTLEDVVKPEEEDFKELADEYYNLEFEDIKGDIPFRCKYDQVMPNSYGLTFEEILMADEQELKRWAALSKMYMKRPENIEKDEASIYLKRGRNEFLKAKILPSLYANPQQPPSKNQKNLTRQKVKDGKNCTSNDNKNKINKPNDKKKSKKKTNKHKKTIEISDKRLLAYNIQQPQSFRSKVL